MNRKDGNRERESEIFMADLSFAAISEKKIMSCDPGLRSQMLKTCRML